MEWLAVLVAVWLAAGGLTALVLARRGHDAPLWVVLGLVLGPVAPAVGASAVRAERRAEPSVVAHGRRGRGRLDVLAAIDGSTESTAALRAAVALHREHLGRLTLALVVPYDADADPDLVNALEAAAGSVAGVRPTTVVLHGEPVAALSRHASEQGDDLLVVGARGRGRSSSPLGSVAVRLAAGAPVPVLIGPGTAAARGR